MTERAQALEAALRELTAMVRGECPSLLNEDSGGNGELSYQIETLLAVQPPPPVGSPTTESVEEAEATVIAQVLAHWFTQGGEARFGSLSMPCTIGRLTATREPSNADELVSQILSRLSCGVPRAVGSIPEE